MTESTSSLDDIFVVIVLFRQTLLESASYQSLTKALTHNTRLPSIMVYDNSPESLKLNARPTELIYAHDPSNPGVSKAYNEAHKIAKKLTKKWLLLADQDTAFPVTIFSDYLMAIQSHPDIHAFSPSLIDSKGFVSPFQLKWGKGKRISSIQSGLNSFKEFKLINSGLLISVDAFQKAGGYDERFPLDYSDIFFSDHVAKNHPNFVLTQSICHHQFSAAKAESDLSTELERFKSFCNAVCLYKKTSPQPVILIWIIIPRALKLSLKMNDFKFLKIGLSKVIQSM